MPADEDGALRPAGEREPLVAGLVDRSVRRRQELTRATHAPFPGLRPGDPLGAVLVPVSRGALQLRDGSGRLESHERSLVRPNGLQVGSACDRFCRWSSSVIKRVPVFVLVLGGIWALWEGTSGCGS